MTLAVVRKFWTAWFVLVAVMFFSGGCAGMRQLSKDTPEGLYRNAQQAMSEHRFNEAHYDFSRIVEKFPDWEYADEALYKKGYLEVVLGKYADAQKSFEMLMEKYPHSEWGFDASVWAGVLGELNACKSSSKTVSKRKKSTRKNTDCTAELKKLKTENEELRRQVQMLRKLFEQ